jgi:hypothetical protein
MILEGPLAAALPLASIGLWVLVVSLGGQGAQRGVLGARNCRAAAGLRSALRYQHWQGGHSRSERRRSAVRVPLSECLHTRGFRQKSFFSTL